MKTRFLILSCLLLVNSLFSQDTLLSKRIEVSAGGSMLIYQSVYSFENIFGFEAAARGKIAGPLDWQAGLRVGVNPVLPEGFARVLVTNGCGVWQPVIGLELGLTARCHFKDGKYLLRESRKAMETDFNPVYVAIHAAPFSFKLLKTWRLSVLELDIGTHVAHFGRTLRAQLNIISIGKKF
jgi:hypothetical protein